MGRKKGGKKTDKPAGGDASSSQQKAPGPSPPQGTKKSDEQGGGDSSASHQKAPGPSAPPKETPSQQQGQGPSQIRDTQQQQDQGPWQTKGKKPQAHAQHRTSPPETPSQQPGQGPWQTKDTQQQQDQGPWQTKGKKPQAHAQHRTSPPETPSQQPGQGPWQTRDTQQQQDQGPWQTKGKKPQAHAQHRTSPPETPSQQPGQGPWQTRDTQQQQDQGPWQTKGKKPQAHAQHRTSPPETPSQQPGQGPWQTRGPQPQQEQGPWQTKGQQPQSHEQQRAPPQDPRSQQGQGPWQTRGPQPQQEQGPWQGKGKQPQSHEQQRSTSQDPRSQQGQGPWQTRGPQPKQEQGPWQAKGKQSQSHEQQRAPTQDPRSQQGDWQTRGQQPQQGQGPRQTRGQPQQSHEQSGSAIIPAMANLSLDRIGGTQIGGTQGRRIQVETNHIGIDFGKLEYAYHYDVQITPDTPKRWLRDVFEEFRKRHFPRNHPAFDGRKNMYSPFKLLDSSKTEVSDEIELSIPHETRTKTYKVTVKFATTVDLSPLRNMRVNSAQQALQCVEIVLRSAASKMCIQAGRSFYTKPPRIIDLGEGCEMYYGHYQTVVRGWKPFFNVDVAHKAFPKRMNVVELIAELSSDWRTTVSSNDLRNADINTNVLNKLGKHLKGLRISYEIPGTPSSKREYRVNGLDDCPRKKTFSIENRTMTIEEYFQRMKNYRLDFPTLPTLWVGSVTRQDKILLPAELCTVIEGQAVNRKMTDNQTSAMIKQAATSTDIRKKKIMSSLSTTNHNADECIREFGFKINRDFEKIGARVLDPPALEYKDGTTCRVTRGTWRQDNLKFLRGADLQSWIIVSTCGNVARECQNFAEMISNQGTKMGMICPKPGNFDCITGWPTKKKVFDMLQQYSQRYSLIFVIINDSGDDYAYVKKAAEITLNCLTQCIKKKTLRKMNPSTVGNILLKVNSKMNGTNHCLKARPPILNEPCMIMGADVTHPSPESKGIPSVVAVTASHDPRALFGYNMCCRLQLPTVEIIEDLENITKEHLTYFYKMNKGQKPYRIIFFRDGVSEGQFAEVERTELMAIRRACSAMEKGYEPKITFVIVQKRHHTRFFPQQKDSEDRNCNVPAGTCVDTVITSPTESLKEFYLVSHASIQGVAKPTKYSTLWDDNDMTHDDVEQLAYYLCHLFSRCNRSVSYPAPTYYAHLGAARAKVYIESEPINLENLRREEEKLKNDVIRKQKPMFFV